ncbi:MAG: hypothetical protein JXQ71_14140 [Verrucomicrobia bacterium]|nr:hypothetical protein [Verrucomicrobiota bacterium]
MTPAAGGAHAPHGSHGHLPSAPRHPQHARAGFTLAEVLAALLFMAIVIPVAVEGVRIASLAGQTGQRKAVAARIADCVLNELVVTRAWQSGAPHGIVRERSTDYEWEMRLEPWDEGVLRQLTVEVLFLVQGRPFDVRLSTLVDPNLQ